LRNIRDTAIYFFLQRGLRIVRSKQNRVIVIGLAVILVTAVIFQRVHSPRVPPQHAPTAAPEPEAAKSYGYEIVREYPHDPQAFTQGLIFRDGFLYESTGVTGKSSLRKVRLETGEVIQQRAVDRGDYGEGVTEWHGRLVQLTPRRRGSAPPWDLSSTFETFKRHFYNIGWTYELASLEPQSSFRYSGDGWGLTHDGRRLIMSDGSSKLRYLDPDTFTELAGLEVSTPAGRSKI
jgi:glutaminyl-peptide cyclotransferase